MSKGKTRCQLFLPDALAARLARIAEGSGRARSELLVEALEAWLSSRNPGSLEAALSARLSRIEGQLAGLRRQQALQWEVLARILRHQLLSAAGLPRADAALQAAAAHQFEAVLDEIAARLAGNPPAGGQDAALDRIRRLAEGAVHGSGAEISGSKAG